MLIIIMLILLKVFNAVELKILKSPKVNRSNQAFSSSKWIHKLWYECNLNANSVENTIL